MDATTCTLQIFIDDAWRDAAALDMGGDPERGVAQVDRAAVAAA